MSEPTTDHSQRVAESAHADEVQSLETALRQSEVRLHTFESTFRQTTTEFISRYAQNEIDETPETIEWLGEARMAQHIRRRIERLFRTADRLAGNAPALNEEEITMSAIASADNTSANELTVLELYRQRWISSGKAAELLGMERIEFIRFAGRQGIAFFDMSEDEFAREIATVDRYLLTS